MNVWLKVIGVATLLGVWATTVWDYALATRYGLVYGSYEVTILTNTYGENYVEIAMLILSVPAIVWIVRMTAQSAAHIMARASADRERERRR